MSRTPDVLGELPTLRYVVAHTSLKSGLAVRSSNIAHDWIGGVQRAVCIENYTHYSRGQMAERVGSAAAGASYSWFGGGPKPPRHDGTPAPVMECSCGFYGWYPWVREDRSWSQWEPTGGAATVVDDDRQHPAVGTITQWMVGGGAGRADMVPVALVADMTGTLVVHDSGVRAEKTRARAVVAPEREIVVPEGYRNSLNRLERKALDLKYRALAHWTNRTAEHLGVSVISVRRALALEGEWDAVRQRIIEGDKGGGLN